MSVNIAGNTVYLSNTEYETLISMGKVTLASGTEIKYSENDTYIVPDVMDSMPVIGSYNSVTSEGIRKELNKGVVSITSSGTTVTYTKADGTQETFSTQDTKYENFNGSNSGLVPNPGATGTTKFLRQDGTWSIPVDLNTATAADSILEGSNVGTEVKYAPYTTQQDKLSFDTSTTNPTKTDRLNLNGCLYATTLYSNADKVITETDPIIKNSASISGTDKKCKLNYNNDENCLEFVFSDN